MLTTKEAIEKRRSIRKYKPDPLPQEILNELIEAARLAPSGCNAQPWRFKIVTDQSTKEKLAKAAHDQKFIAQAPAVIICCASLKEYIDSSVSGVQDLENIGAIGKNIVQEITQRADLLQTFTPEQLGVVVEFNVAIAIEHIVLRALDYGLGTCWIRLIDKVQIQQIFNWDKKMFIAALLPIGYPAEDPKPRRRKLLNEIII
jgi:nitroreductase